MQDSCPMEDSGQMDDNSGRVTAPFVDGWSVGDTLGEGAFGEVKRVINRFTHQAVAMKVVNLADKPERVRELVHKEITIHKRLDSPHIVKYYGMRAEKNQIYIFLEYASGGELFDRIEPDVGMSCWEAQKYFRELLSGLQYLHSLGIVHRDIKPENLLLDSSGTLKICDFGLATVFRTRSNGKMRFLEKCVGSPSYIAPEVYMERYLAEPADIWSCGIVLIAMLTGELPWDRAIESCAEYKNWKTNSNLLDLPWSKLDNMALSLLRKLLHPLPGHRYGITQILKHRWMLKKFESVSDTFQNRDMQIQPSTKLAYSSSIMPLRVREMEEAETRMCSSQPLPHIIQEEEDYQDSTFSFSQPADVDALLLSSQVSTDGDAMYLNLVRRMTRFFVLVSCEQAIEALRNILEKKDNYRLKRIDYMLTITTVDKTKNPLVFKVNALDMGGKTLLDFRRSTGCGLEFKRRFVLIKSDLSNIITDGIVSWPIATVVPTIRIDPSTPMCT